MCLRGVSLGDPIALLSVAIFHSREFRHRSNGNDLAQPGRGRLWEKRARREL